MSGFQALMALSATQTKESQSAVQSALQQRQRNEELKRKHQEEQDKKQREMERKLRMKHFEDEKREQERRTRMEDDRKAKEAALQRREEEQRDALRYGPKKAKAMTPGEGPTSKWPSSQSSTREEVRKRRLPDDEDDSAPVFLTREEKREMKMLQEQRKLFQPSKRSSQSGGYLKAGRRLPGGAVDVTTTLGAGESSASTKSVKERISAMPNTLTKLNTVKRDTRTIDEILQDRAKAKEVKILDGDQAREFDDWFGTKKKEPAKKSPVASGSAAPTSGANTPASQGSNFSSAGVGPAKAPGASKPTPLKSGSKPAGYSKLAAPNGSRSSYADRYTTAPKTSSLPPGKISKSSAPPGSGSAPVARPSSVAAKKRPRSTSRSESPPPKRRVPSPGLGTISSQIWEIFGRKRDDYVGKDVLSDDDEMEADATLMEREEKQSARIAKREEQQALEEERRHEEEKRRRRKEKEARERERRG